MKTVLKCVVSGAAALTLACGGGGQSGPDISYSGSKTVVTIDESNVGTMTSMASATASGFAGGSYGSVPLKTGAAAQSDLRATTHKALSLFAAARRSSAVALTGVSGSESQNCDGGGSMTLAFNVRDPSGSTVQNGDWIQISFNNCRDAYSLETITGSMRMTAVNVDGDFPSFDDPTFMTPGFQYKVRLALNDFAVSEPGGAYSGVSADMTMSVLWNDVTFELSKSVSGSAVAMVSHDGTKVVEASLLTAVPGTAGYAFDTVDTYSDAYASSVVANAWGMSARMCSLEIAGCLDVVVDPAFFQRLTDTYPDAGTFRITGANGAYVELTALDGVTGDVTLTWDLDGAGAFLPVTVATKWACLNTPGLCQP